MTNINNESNLYWVYTKYAKERLANFGAKDKMYLYKLKIGDYNWYADEKKKLGTSGYSEKAFKEYFQKDGINDLGNFIKGENEYEDYLPLEFFITGKEVDNNRESVILTTTIDETFGGFDIREIGIYETIDGEDHLFAVCTMQPIPKPGIETNHYISSQFNCHLFSQKLIDIFDDIEINKNNSYVTIPELQDYQTNLLFVESNLAEQISRNSQLIGYNRVEQLYQLIKENQKNYAKFGMTSIYANLSTMAEVRNFWVFDQTNTVSRATSLKDLSLNHENLGTDQLSTRYQKDYQGVSAWLNFDRTHHYALLAPSDVTVKTTKDVTEYYAPNRDDFIFIDIEKDEAGKIISTSDSPFTIIWLGAQNDNGADRTLMAKYNTFAEHPGLSVIINKKRQCVVSLYSSSGSYLTFTTPENSIPKAGTFYSLIVDYNGDVDKPAVTVVINEKVLSTSVTNHGTLYTGMTVPGMLLPMYSFIRSEEGDKSHVNSKVCLLALLKGTLSDAHKQSISYSLMSLIGNNPCLI